MGMTRYVNKGHIARATVEATAWQTREVLDARIAERVDGMWQSGFVDEVRRLAEAGLAQTPTASKALGYQQVLSFLAGEITEDDARQLTIDATRRFARRQQRWFRRDGRISWIDYDDGAAVEGVLSRWGSDTLT